jgi:hypothetical protein
VNERRVVYNNQTHSFKVRVGSTPVATGTAVFPSRNRSIIVDDV